jgi:hypothetical protein
VRGLKTVRSLWIRGDATQFRKQHQWDVRSEREILSFMGESGMNLAPKKWAELKITDR